MTTTTRVLRGDVRTAHGRDYIVLGTCRGRRGEARTMVTIGYATAGGGAVVYPAETWTHATVAGHPRKGRVRLSVRAAGGHHYYEAQ